MRELMSTEDKIKNKIEDLGGKAKEAIGKVTGDTTPRTKARRIRRSPT
jgi:uncharacterized protein YjbJ (UPF0337 family)